MKNIVCLFALVAVALMIVPAPVDAGHRVASVRGNCHGQNIHVSRSHCVTPFVSFYAPPVVREIVYVQAAPVYQAPLVAQPQVQYQQQQVNYVAPQAQVYAYTQPAILPVYVSTFNGHGLGLGACGFHGHRAGICR